MITNKKIIIIRLILQLVLISVLYTKKKGKCPLRKYGRGCFGRCLCNWPGTIKCHSVTGKCMCNSGHTGIRCDLDANECDLPRSPCHRINTLCQNTFGGYQCFCQDGYVLSNVGYCISCDSYTYGKNCSKICSCDIDNSLYCDATGLCVCKLGWTGLNCDLSQDDCIGKSCPEGTVCVDGHRTHSCLCPEGQRYIIDQCHDYTVDVVTSDLSPNVGELIDLIVLYKMPPMYSLNLPTLPDFAYNVVVEELPERELCDLSFFETSQPMTGNEWFISELNIEKTYNFYSHIKLWLLSANETTVRLVPFVKEYEELLLVYDVSYKAQAVNDCLHDMEIIETSKTPFSPKTYRRQSYNSFEINMNTSDECREVPRIEWTYYSVSSDLIAKGPRRCLDAAKVVENRIDDLINAAEEHAISDHKSMREIVPKGTLPIGVNLICVRAYILSKKRLGAGICGFIEIVASYVVEGRLLPSTEYIHWPSHFGINIQASFIEPDLHSPIVYDWECISYSRAAPQDKSTCLTDIAIRDATSSSQTELQIPEEVLSEGMTYTISVTASLKSNKIFQTKDRIQLQIEDSSFLPMLLVCIKSCAQIIGSNKNVVLHVTFPYLRETMQSITYNWEIDKDDQALSHDDVMKILGQTTVTHYSIYDSYYVSTKTKSLLPGSKYMFRCSSQIRVFQENLFMNRSTFQSLAMYSLEIEAPPQGEGCTISPHMGDAVFTKFTVVCKNYVDTVANLPLMYRLYQLDKVVGQTNTFYNLIAFSGSDVMGNITLSSRGSTGGTSTVTLMAEVKNVKGTGVEIQLSVTLRTLDQRMSLGKIGGKINVLGGGQEDARNFKDIATTIAFDGTASFKDKLVIRRELLENIFKLDSFSPENIEQVSHVLGITVEKEDEIEASGLDNGINTAHKLAKVLGKLKNENFDLTRNVAKDQLNAVSKLLSVASVAGEKITHMNHTEIPEADSLLNKNIEQSILATDSFSNIAEVLLNSITSVNEKIEVSTEFMKFLVSWSNVSENTHFDIASDNVKFSLPTEDSGVLKSEVVESEYEVYKHNPYGWTTAYVHGDLPVVKVNLVRQNEKHDINAETDKKVFRFSKPADVFINYTAAGEELVYPVLIKVVTQNKMKLLQMSSCLFMSVKVSTESATVIKLISRENLIIKVKVKYTNIISYFENLLDEDMLDMPLNMPGDSYDSSEGQLHRHKDLLFLPELTKQQYKRNHPYYRIKISMKLYQKVNTAALKRVYVEASKREEGEDVPPEYYNISIAITPHVMSCLKFDQVKKDYLSDDCAISMYSNLKLMYCRCVVAAAFTGSVLVQPRLISPLDIGLFLYIFQNPLVVSTVIAIWLIYFAMISWAHYKDKEDETKNLITILDDYAEDHSYIYLICVVTGWSASASTSSNVFIFLKGTWGHTGNHTLQDPERRLFESGAENWFMMATKDDVGELLSVVVWTDFSGATPAWFLSSVYVQNLQTSESWVCPYNSWISVHTQLVAEIPAFKETEYSSQWLVKIMSKGHNDIRNEHLWLGIIAKTSYNKFSRVRRLSTALSVLLTLMILNLMFFGISDKDDPGQFIDVLDQKIHVTSVIIGIQTAFIIFVVGVAITMLFQKVAPFPKNIKEDEERNKNMQEFLERRNTIMNVQDLSESSGFIESAVNESEIMPDISVSSQRNQNLSNRDHSVDLTHLYSVYSSPVDIDTSEIGSGTGHEGGKPESTKPANKPFMLPYWFIYIIWVMLLVYNVFLSYYIMLYGLSLGYERSVDWILAFVTGFFMNVAIIQPIKVVIMVFLLVLVFKEGHTFRDRSPVAKLNDGIMLVQERKSFNRKYRIIAPRTGCKAPVLSADAKLVLKRLAYEAEAREMLRDLFLHSLFLISILIVSYGHVDVRVQFMQTQHTRSVFLGHSILGDVQGHYISEYLSHVVKVEDMWDYIENIVAPQMAKDKVMINTAHDTYLMGSARLRQIRAKPVTLTMCSLLPRTIRGFFRENSCAFATYAFPEETNSYEGTWTVVTNISKDEIDDSPYVYRSPKDLSTGTFIGLHGIYSGGGYVVPFGRDDLSAVHTLLSQLSDSDWINEHTRCVFLEFTLYNSGSDLFTNVMIAFEFDNFGAVFPYVSINSGMFFDDKRKQQVWLHLSEAFMIVYVLFYLIVEIQSFRQKGYVKYFQNLWNCLGVVTILLTIAVGVMFFLRYAEFVKILKKFQLYGHGRFLDFQFAFRIHEYLQISLASLGFVVILKMLKVTSFNRFVDITFRTFANSRADFFGLSLVTLIFLFNFAFCGLLVFGKNLESYMSIDRGFFTLLFFIMGEPDYLSLVEVDVFMGRFYFVLLVVVCQYIVMNFFCSILKEGYELTRYMEFKKQDDIMQYMISTIKYYSGYGLKNQSSQKDKILY